MARLLSFSAAKKIWHIPKSSGRHSSVRRDALFYFFVFTSPCDNRVQNCTTTLSRQAQGEAVNSISCTSRSGSYILLLRWRIKSKEKLWSFVKSRRNATIQRHHSRRGALIPNPPQDANTFVSRGFGPLAASNRRPSRAAMCSQADNSHSPRLGLGYQYIRCMKTGIRWPIRAWQFFQAVPKSLRKEADLDALRRRFQRSMRVVTPRSLRTGTKKLPRRPINNVRICI